MSIPDNAAVLFAPKARRGPKGRSPLAFFRFSKSDGILIIMSPLLKPKHLKRYGKILYFFFRENWTAVLKKNEFDDTDDKKENNPPYGKPEEFVNHLEEMGPTFIKLGQFLSTRPDIITVPYIKALSRLQDNVAPMPFEAVEQIIREELEANPFKAFAFIEKTPVASASLAQVHYARLHSGEEVVLKVQRPGIKKMVKNDLDALQGIIATAEKHSSVPEKYNIGAIFDVFYKSLLRELDFRQEANSLKIMRRNLERYDTIVVPYTVDSYCTDRLVTMQYLKGIKITELSPLKKTEADTAGLAEDLMKAYLDQVLIYGFFHSDPHPGNILYMPDNKLALIDLGMVGYVSPELQDKLIKLLLNMVDGKTDEVTTELLEIAEEQKSAGVKQFKNDVSDIVLQHKDLPLSDLKLGHILLKTIYTAVRHGIRPVSELTMLGKILLQLDEITKHLNPDFDPNKTIRNYSDTLLKKHLLKQVSTENIFSTVLETAEFIRKLPARANKILDTLINHQLEVRTKFFIEEHFTKVVEKSANRIGVSLIISALIIGAAFLIRVETEFTLLGYPGLAILFFFAAAALGIGVIISILREKRR